MTSREAFRNAIEVMQAPARFMSGLLPGFGLSRECEELDNKLQAFRLYEYADRELNLPLNPVWSLYSIVHLALSRDDFDAIWLLEGIGRHYASAARDLNAALSSGVGGELPARAMLSLHAGFGMAFAERTLGAIGGAPSDLAIQRAIERFLDLCRANCRNGWEYGSVEPIGFIARTLYPRLLHRVADAMSAYGLEYRRLFWHGAGRGLYFTPTNFMPFAAAHSRALESAITEPPSGEDKLNCAAGLAFAVTMVNLPQPGVIREFMTVCDLRGVRPAFSNGVLSALVAWRSAAPSDARCLPPFLQTESGRSSSALWNETVAGPAIEIFSRVYPALERHHHIARVYTYRPADDWFFLAREVA